MEFRVIEICWFGDICLVVYDWMQFADPQNIHNLYAYDRKGKKLWIAEQRRPGDFFTHCLGGNELLQVITWECFRCTLDPETGQIISTEFIK